MYHDLKVKCVASERLMHQEKHDPATRIRDDGTPAPRRSLDPDLDLASANLAWFSSQNTQALSHLKGIHLLFEYMAYTLRSMNTQYKAIP